MDRKNPDSVIRNLQFENGSLSVEQQNYHDSENDDEIFEDAGEPGSITNTFNDSVRVMYNEIKCSKSAAATYLAKLGFHAPICSNESGTRISGSI